MSWTPLRLLHVEVLGIHPRWSRLLVVRLPLSARPPTRWRQLFDEVASLLPVALEQPAQVDDEGITISPTDQDLERDVALTEERVRLANARYALEQRVPRPPSTPGVRAFSTTVELNETLSADVRARIEAARHRAAGLTGVFQSALWSSEELEPAEPAPE